MKAVNLIPTEERRGTRTGGDGVGYASYVLIAVLALLLGGTYLYVSAGNTAKSRTAQIAKLKASAATEQAAARALQPYVDFATTAQARISTVKSIADGRFSWYLAMRDLSRVLPRNVWLTSFTGTVTPGVAFGDSGGGGGNTATLRAQMPNNPAVELSGCTVSNDSVARLLSRLRLINGVVRVSLAAAEKSSTAAPTANSGVAAPSAGVSGGSDTGGDCRNGSDRFPQFSVVVFFKELPASAATTSAQPGAPAAAASAAPSTSTSAAPATTTTPAPAAGAQPTQTPQPAQSGQPAAGGTSTTPGAATPSGSAPAPTGASN